jgi:hypothetical protein
MLLAFEKAYESMLTKVFHFDSPREKYECDAVIVWCFDNRFNVAFSKFLKRRATPIAAGAPGRTSEDRASGGHRFAGSADCIGA